MASSPMRGLMNVRAQGQAGRLAVSSSAPSGYRVTIRANEGVTGEGRQVPNCQGLMNVPL